MRARCLWADTGVVESICVLTRSTLPGTLRVAEVDLDIGGDGELLVIGHLRSPVLGQGIHHGPGQLLDLIAQGLHDAFGVFASHSHQHHEPRAAFDQAGWRRECCVLLQAGLLPSVRVPPGLRLRGVDAYGSRRRP